MIKGRVPWRQCLRHTLTLRLHAHCVSLRAGSSLRRCLRRLTQTIVLLGRGPHCLSLYQELTMWMLARAPPGVCFRHCVYIFSCLISFAPIPGLYPTRSQFDNGYERHMSGGGVELGHESKFKTKGSTHLGTFGVMYYKHVKIND